MEKELAAILFKKLHDIQESNSSTITINNLDDIARLLLEELNDNHSSEHEKEIYNQLSLIIAQIDSLKHDISNVSDDILNDHFIPDITIELKAIILQVEKSVTNILDISDEIITLCKDITDPIIKEKLMIKITRIFELCNFQDITGQKIQRITHHLNETESVINKLLHAFAPEESLRSRKIHKNIGLAVNYQKNQDEQSQNCIDDLLKNF